MRRNIFEAAVAAAVKSFGVSREDLVGRRLGSGAWEARAAIAIALYRCGLASGVIGEGLGGRSHSAIRGGVARLEVAMEIDETLAAKVAVVVAAVDRASRRRLRRRAA